MPALAIMNILPMLFQEFLLSIDISFYLSVLKVNIRYGITRKDFSTYIADKMYLYTQICISYSYTCIIRL